MQQSPFLIKLQIVLQFAKCFVIDQYYFAYGSNMNPARMRARGLDYRHCQAARLPGYELRFNKRSHSDPDTAYANVVPNPRSAVEGVLYCLSGQDTSVDILSLLDVYEGTPVRYSRERVAVMPRAGGVQYCWLYVANPAFVRGGLLPRRRYLQHLLAAERHLSAPYLARLQAQSCLPDRDGGNTEEALRFNV